MTNPVGRPTKYRDDMPQRAYDVLAAGGSIAKVAATLDVAKAQVYEWMGVHPEFQDAIKRGLAVAESMWEDPGFHPDMNAMRYRLNMANRFGWGEKNTTEVTGEDGGPLKAILDIVISSNDDVLSRVRGEDG